MFILYRILLVLLSLACYEALASGVDELAAASSVPQQKRMVKITTIGGQNINVAEDATFKKVKQLFAAKYLVNVADGSRQPTYRMHSSQVYLIDLARQSYLFAAEHPDSELIVPLLERLSNEHALQFLYSAVPVKFVTNENNDFMILVDAANIARMKELSAHAQQSANYSEESFLGNTAEIMERSLAGNQSVQRPLSSFVRAVWNYEDISIVRRKLAFIFGLPATEITLTLQHTSEVLADGKEFADCLTADNPVIVVSTR